MKKSLVSLKQFLLDESGPTAVEYAVMLALIVIVCIGAISAIGQSSSDVFQEVANQL